jgi:hypothetical protein
MADQMRATPQSPTLGAIAAALRKAQQFTGQYQVDPRVPLLGGTGVDELLALPGAASLMEDVSYNGPRAMIRGGNAATGGIGTFRLDPRVADVAEVGLNVAPLGALAARGAKVGARATGEALNRAILDNSGPLAKVVPQAAKPLYVVKPKGGNWLSGAVESAIQPLHTRPEWLSGEMINEAAGENLWARMVQEGSHQDPHSWLRENRPDIYNQFIGPEGAAVNRWLDTKLSKYIRNEMGTPEDPVRALAERGILHVDAVGGGLDYAPGDVVRNRLAADSMVRTPTMDSPGTRMGVMPAAREWEDATDAAIVPRSAGDLTAGANKSPYWETSLTAEHRLEQDPWLAKLPYDAPVYTTRESYTLADDLGLPHLVDELKFSMDPNSDLPDNLRFDIKDIDKITVPQAVERVSQINTWRAKQAAEAEKAGMLGNLQAAPRLADEGLQLSFVDKPGGAWVDIPDTMMDEKGMPVCTSIGKAGGWCTQNRWAAESYGSGTNRLTALLDTEGRPHAQAKITREADEMAAIEDATMYLTPEQEAAYDKYFQQLDRPPELEESLLWLQDYAPEAYAVYKDVLASQPKAPPSVTELKPPGNSFESDRAQEYIKRDPQYKDKVTDSVLRFLNGGEWGKVKDLHHYDIVDLQDPSSVLKGLSKTGQSNREIAAYFNDLLDNDPDLPRFMTKRQLTDLVQDLKTALDESADDAPGFQAGGIVRGAVKSIGELAEKYSAKRAPKAVPKVAPKAALEAVEGTTETLPKKEAAANLRKFVRPSAVKQRVFHGSNVPEGIVEDKQFAHYGPDSSEIHWFSESPEHANEYTYKYLESEGDQGAIFPVNLQIKKPLEIPFNMNQRADSAFKDHIRKLGIYPSSIEEWAQMNDLSKPSKVWQFVNTPVFREIAQRRGFDGIKVQERDFATWGTFEPTQIKSQFNRGTYDVTDPDPNFQAGGIVKGAVKGIGELVERYLAKEGAEAAAEAAPKAAPKEHVMLQGLYRGYAGEQQPAAREFFLTPQKRVADFYAKKRAAQTGAEPHADMVLVPQNAGEVYGHGTIGMPEWGFREPMFTNARRKIAPTDIKGRTQLYAAGGLVTYDPNEIDTIVSQLKEEFHA